MKKNRRQSQAHNEDLVKDGVLFFLALAAACIIGRLILKAVV